MKIKPIVLASVLCAAVPAAAANAQGAGGQPPLDPAKLTEAQIAQTQVPTALLRLAAIYKQSGDQERLTWALERLVALQPNVGDLKLALATAYAQRGEKSKTYELLLAMQKQGFGYDLADNPNFSKVADTRAWKYVVENLAANLKPFGEGKVAFTLPAGDMLLESLAYDPKRKQFLAGSVREGKVYRVGKDGKLEEFIAPDAQNGLWSVYAMAADPDDDALYVASTASVYFKGFDQADFGKAGVFKFRLSSGKLLDKYLLAPDRQPRTLSSIAVGKGGLVFAADGLRNVIYRLDGGQLKPMVENPKLTSLRGMAVSGDGKTLYFADYAMGVFGVDLAAGKAFDLEHNPAALTLGGIDGLYWYDGALVAIENGMTPRRVIRLSLGENGRGIVKATPLDVANPAFGLPTYGTIDGEGLYFVANSQKNAYDTYGTPKAGAKLEPVRVFRSNLRYAWNERGIDTRVQNPRPLSTSRPGSGPFGNVEGGSQSVSGN
jgi:sugar lactone lactonase YvrE